MDAPVFDAVDRAFPTHARPERYFPAGSIESARQRLVECLVRGDGPAVAIGAPGVGKTMLLEVAASAVRDRLRVASLSGAQLCTRRALLQALLFELGLPYGQRAEGDLRLGLHQALSEGDPVALLVDEAQSLSAKILEELRVLANLAKDGLPIVRLALFGGPALEDIIATPEMETFSQRIAARCYLNPLTYEETREYVRAHAAAVRGVAEEVFANDALDAVFHGSDGIPRLVSQLAERSLAIARRERCGIVDAGVVQLAWSDLHQLPAPWNTPRVEEVAAETVVASNEPSVEFGELEEAYEPESQVDLTETTVFAPESDLSKSPEFIADRALNQLPLAEAETGDESQTDDPFGDGFDEEEIVIDRFVGIETVFHVATPRVTNVADPSLSALAGSLENADSETVESIDDQTVETTDGFFDTEIDEEEEKPIAEDELTTLQLASHEAGDQEDDVLVIVDDLEEADASIAPMVRRREYRQLFAQLRHG